MPNVIQDKVSKDIEEISECREFDEIANATSSDVDEDDIDRHLRWSLTVSHQSLSISERRNFYNFT